jgi:hypothetical protein
MNEHRIASLIAITAAIGLLASELSFKMSLGIGLLVWALLPSYTDRFTLTIKKKKSEEIRDINEPQT